MPSWPHAVHAHRWAECGAMWMGMWRDHLCFSHNGVDSVALMMHVVNKNIRFAPSILAANTVACPSNFVQAVIDLDISLSTTLV